MVSSFSTFPALFSLSLSLTCILHTMTCGHSSLTKPELYTRAFCNDDSCPICPRFPAVHEMANSASRPEETWSRGQIVEVRWARNNHDGGLIRIGIVPVADMFDELAHERYAFRYGCWEQGLYSCGAPSSFVNKCHGDWCGADKTSRGYRIRDLKVPAVIPDGVYRLSFILCGGIDWETRTHGRFGNYM